MLNREAKYTVNFKTTGLRELDRLVDQAKNLQVGVGGTSKSFGALAVAAGASVAVLGAVGVKLWSIVQNAGKSAEELLNLADRLDLTAKQALKLQIIAGITGVNIGALEGASRQLGSALEDQLGSGKKAADTLRQLGIQTVTTSGQQRNMGSVLMEVLGVLSRIDNQAELVTKSQALLGRGSKELLPLIKAYKDMRSEADAMGRALDENGIRKLAEMDDAIGKVSTSWDLLWKSIAARIAPIVIPVFAKLSGVLQPGAPEPDRGSLAAAGDRLGALGLDARANAAAGVPSGGPAFDLINQDLARGKQLSAGFRNSQGRTLEGSRTRLAELRKRSSELANVLGSDGIGGSRFAVTKAEFDELQGQIAELSRQIELLEKSKPFVVKSGDLDEFQRANKGNRGAPSLINNRVGFRKALEKKSAEFVSPESDRVQIGDPQGQQRAFLQGLIDSGRSRAELTRATQQAELAAKIRILELSDDEVAAAVKIRDLRKASAETILDAKQAELDFEIRIAEINKRRNDDARDAAGRTFDSIRSSGSGGIGALARGMVDSLLRQVFVNATAEIFKAGQKTLGKAIPGQTNAAGELTPLGRVLKGTVFGQQADAATVQNTTATQQNTAALQQLSSVVASGGTAGGGAAAAGAGAAGAGAGVSGTSGFSKGLGKALGVAGAGFGVFAGIKQGGLRGGLNATSSALAGASLFAGPVAGAALMGVSAGLQLIQGFLGDPRQKRDEQINKQLERSRFSEPAGISKLISASGAEIDYDSRGNIRVYNITQNMDVQAWDSRSFADNRHEIAGALRTALQEDSEIIPEIQRAINPR